MRIALALAALTAASAAAADDLPSRKAGLWESKTVSQDGATTAKQCLDDDTDREAQEAATAAGVCSKATVRKTADGFETETSCGLGQITAEGRGVVTGDFVAYLRTETTTTLKGMPGVDKPTPRRTVTEARRLGDCEPGQKPGDVILSDGRVIHRGQ